MAHPLVRAFVQWVTLTVLLGVMLVGYVWFTESRAETRARAFCADLKIGANTADLLERAYSAGADSRQTRRSTSVAGESSFFVTFTGFMPLSRHICSIGVQNDVVKKFDYTYMD